MQETMKNSEKAIPALAANELLSETAQWWSTELRSWLQKVEKGEQEVHTGYGAYHRSRGLFENASRSLSGIPNNDHKIEELVIGQLTQALKVTPDGPSRTEIVRMLKSVSDAHASRA